jgi:hypothetical protein
MLVLGYFQLKLDDVLILLINSVFLDSTTSTSIDRDISLKSDVTCENARHMDCEPFIK